MEEIDPRLDDKHNVDNLSYTLACDTPPEPSASVGANVQLDRSGRNLLRQVVEADYKVYIINDEDMAALPDGQVRDVLGYVDEEAKDVVLRRSTLAEPDRGVGILAHEFAHVVDAPKREAAFVAFDAAREELWAKQKEELDKRNEAKRKWDKRGAVYKHLPWHQDEKPKKLTDPGKQPETKASIEYREELVETEVRAYTWAREIAQQLGLPCISGTGTVVPSHSAPDDPFCHPVPREELLRQLRDSSYADLFSPELLKWRLYNPDVWPDRAKPPGAEGAPAPRAAADVIRGAPASVPGTTDANGVYTVTWDDIDPNRAVTEVFNAQGDEDGIIEGVPATEPGTTDENGIYTVTWEDIDPNRAVTEVFNAQGDEDGIIEGVPATEPGTTDENGVYTVAWEDIAADVESDTGFVAQSDEVVHEEGIAYGEPMTEAGTTDAEGVYTVAWEDIAPADPVAEVFSAEGDADGIIEGEPAAEPGTTDAEGVYTVAWEDIADDVEAETGFTAEPDAAPAEGIITGEPITEQPLAGGEDMVAVVAAAAGDTSSADG